MSEHEFDVSLVSDDNWHFNEDSGHVVPLNDTVTHTQTDDGHCVCGPTIHGPVGINDGPLNRWLYFHHSLDGREA